MRARGFSLVEALVATTLLAGGLLAVVASMRAMQRLELLGRRQAEAAEAGAGRLALIRATACMSPSSGASSGAIATQWSVGPSSPLIQATVNVTFRHDGRTRSLRYDASFFCGTAP